MSANGHAVRPELTPGHFLFTSESVGEGHPGMFVGILTSCVNSLFHPDKICDQVSDAIVTKNR
jgi:S-adenosylmethionine synthetase